MVGHRDVSSMASLSRQLRAFLQRPITTEDGLEVGMEEYFDYIFPDEAAAAPNLKLLEAAQRWKRQKVMENGA